MNRHFLKFAFCIACNFAMLSLNSNAQTNIPGGNVSGTWTVAGSPYLIQASIMIPNDSTLTIEPGVTVNFQGTYKMYVQGRVIAIGTATDTIIFTATDTTNGWRGIRFDNTPATNDSSKFFYCKLQYGKATGVSPDDNESVRTYMRSDREDWMPPFETQEDRAFVVRIYEVFIKELVDREAVTTDQFILDSIRMLETFNWRMRKETEGYDFIFVDELQLFDPQERAALELLGRLRMGVPFVTAEDPSQGVFSSINRRHNESTNEMIYLETVHRFNRGIFDFISFIYGRFPLNAIPLKTKKQDIDNSERPIVYACDTPEAALDRAVSIAHETSKISSAESRICVATLGDFDTLVANKLEERALKVTLLSSFDDVEQLAYSKRSIVVSPWEFVGGTQFSHVIVVAAGLASPRSQFARRREMISVYLSCSRAADRLHIICDSYTPSIVQEALENGLVSQGT